MTIQHLEITDPFVHEPKGITSAAEHTVYVSDGAGSGTWKKVNVNQVHTAYTSAVIAEVAAGILDGSIPLPEAEVMITKDISNISSAQTIYIPVPEDAEVLQMQMVIGGAITSADALITLANAAGSEICSQVFAQAGSAAGVGYTVPAAANQTLTGPTYLRVSTDGGSTGAVPLFITVHLKITRTA